MGQFLASCGSVVAMGGDLAPIWPFSSPKTYFQNKIFFLETFLPSSYFALHPITCTSRNIGGTDAWAVPHLKLGAVPQPPLSLPPRGCGPIVGKLWADCVSVAGKLWQWRAEAVGCPGPTRFLDALKIFSIRPAKFLTTFFSCSPNSLLECPHQCCIMPR